MERDKIIKVLTGLSLCAATIFIFFPGSYSNDSWAQFIHLSKHWYDDWFGPAMVSLWRTLWLATGSYFSLYLLLMITYWLFIMALAWNSKINSFRFWGIMVTGLFFCFIPQYVMRDSLMAISWGLAALLIFSLDKGRYQLLIVAAILLLSMYGLWLRPNALAALFPFTMALVVSLKKQLSIIRSALLALGISLLIFAGTNVLSYRVFHAWEAYPGYKLKLLDLAGISKLSGHNYFPGCMSSYPTFNYDTIIARYTAATFDHIYWSDDKLIPEPDAALNACVRKSWLAAIADHPFLYLRNRFDGFLYYLRIKKRFANVDYWNVTISIDPENPLGVTQQPNSIRDGFAGIYRLAGRLCLFDPWVWLVLNAAIFAWSVNRHRQGGANYYRILACIALSGVFFILSQFFIYQHDRDFRYSYWNVFVVLIAIGSGRKRGL